MHELSRRAKKLRRVLRHVARIDNYTLADHLPENKIVLESTDDAIDFVLTHPETTSPSLGRPSTAPTGMVTRAQGEGESASTSATAPSAPRPTTTVLPDLDGGSVVGSSVGHFPNPEADDDAADATAFGPSFGPSSLTPPAGFSSGAVPPTMDAMRMAYRLKWMMGSGPAIHIAVQESGGSIAKTMDRYGGGAGGRGAAAAAGGGGTCRSVRLHAAPRLSPPHRHALRYSDAWLAHVPLLVISNKFKRLARKQRHWLAVELTQVATATGAPARRAAALGDHLLIGSLTHADQVGRDSSMRTIPFRGSPLSLRATIHFSTPIPAPR